MSAFRLFPALEEIFAHPSASFKYVFLPLLTVDLSALGKGKGKAHFIEIMGEKEPDNTTLDDKMGYNFVRFKRAGDMYVFEGDLNYVDLDNFAHWYGEAEEEYRLNKKDYLTPKPSREAVEHSMWRKNRNASENLELRNHHLKLSKEAKDKNTWMKNKNAAEYLESRHYYLEKILNYWITRDKFLETGKFIHGSYYTEWDYSSNEGEVYLDEDFYDDYWENIEELVIGDLVKRMTCAGLIEGYSYVDHGADEIWLFTDEREAVLYFNWT
ncbi:MAG: hypothetical protein LBB55_01575 [Zoogloeaceae bacterium]|nr:hypothetical protein [Zoogloeaceae bacterium]